MAELFYTSLFTDPNILEYWRLEGNGNNTKGFQNLDANASGLVFSAAEYGLGINFGATNTTQYMSNTNVGFVDGGAMTMVFWNAMLTEIGSGVQTFMSQYSTGTKTSFHVDYVYNGGNRFIQFVRTKLGSGDDFNTYTVALGQNVKHHFAFTYDGTNLRGYLDGILISGPTAASGNGVTTATNGIMIGGFLPTSLPGAPTNAASTLMDDVAIFNRALSNAEILKLSTNPSPAFLFELL